MLRVIMLATGLLTALTPAQAEKLYLSCTFIEQPKFTMADLYATAPKSQEIFIKDVWKAGAAGAIVGPPKTWVIDTVSQTIGSPEGNGDYTQTQASVSEIQGAFRSEGGTLKTFLLNRLDGSLTLSTYYAPHSFDDWKVAHGKSFPLNWTWRQSCNLVTPM